MIVAQNELFRLLELNSLPRFIQSPLYKAYVNREPFKSAFSKQTNTSRTYAASDDRKSELNKVLVERVVSPDGAASVHNGSPHGLAPAASVVRGKRIASVQMTQPSAAPATSSVPRASGGNEPAANHSTTSSAAPVAGNGSAAPSPAPAMSMPVITS